MPFFISNLYGQTQEKEEQPKTKYRRIGFYDFSTGNGELLSDENELSREFRFGQLNAFEEIDRLSRIDDCNRRDQSEHISTIRDYVLCETDNWTYYQLIMNNLLPNILIRLRCSSLLAAERFAKHWYYTNLQQSGRAQRIPKISSFYRYEPRTRRLLFVNLGQVTAYVSELSLLPAASTNNNCESVGNDDELTSFPLPLSVPRISLHSFDLAIETEYKPLLDWCGSVNVACKYLIHFSVGDMFSDELMTNIDEDFWSGLRSYLRARRRGKISNTTIRTIDVEVGISKKRKIADEKQKQSQHHKTHRHSSTRAVLVKLAITMPDRLLIKLLFDTNDGDHRVSPIFRNWSRTVCWTFGFMNDVLAASTISASPKKYLNVDRIVSYECVDVYSGTFFIRFLDEKNGTTNIGSNMFEPIPTNLINSPFVRLHIFPNIGWGFCCLHNQSDTPDNANPDDSSVSSYCSSESTIGSDKSSIPLYVPAAPTKPTPHDIAPIVWSHLKRAMSETVQELCTIATIVEDYRIQREKHQRIHSKSHHSRPLQRCEQKSWDRMMMESIKHLICELEQRGLNQSSMDDSLSNYADKLGRVVIAKTAVYQQSNGRGKSATLPISNKTKLTLRPMIWDLVELQQANIVSTSGKSSEPAGDNRDEQLYKGALYYWFNSTLLNSFSGC